MATTNDNILSYNNIKNTLTEWKRSGTRESRFNSLDMPGHLFFKVVFHFWNGDAYGTMTGGNSGWIDPSQSVGLESGLIAPTWNWDGNIVTPEEQRADIQEYTDNIVKFQNHEGITDISTIFRSYHNSAYNFLIRNDELERAEKLRQFITLLSNISTYSPWYFSEITGLDAVLERGFNDKDMFKVEDPKSITIKCLPDSMDNRIATLLDLYRDVTYSYVWHKQILPANLRKFDMSIYIFDSMISSLHFKNEYSAVMAKTNDSVAGQATEWTPSYKRIELHDCEIDYNASKSGYSSLNNTDGFQQTFEIPIKVGEAYEFRYNSFIDREIGDMIAVDLFAQTYSAGQGNVGSVDKSLIADAAQKNRDAVLDALANRIHFYENNSLYTRTDGTPISHLDGYPQRSDGINLLRVADDLTGNVVSDAAKSFLLGNIFGTDIQSVAGDVSRIINGVASGNVGAVIEAGKDLVDFKGGWYSKRLDNIATGPNIYTRTPSIFQPNNMHK